ncbi:L,D-transpeptidase [Micromonospora endolithica]|uniref:L,D-transpeptidase n=1 Tax=Micromonospora endolithica TaxID=230091 RepID=A0A3A9ZV62_9ACTN|nr:L,D-transpeptidase [Micromonospora endolithica]RKN51237.1 L,D-transpeptidase [Micromonospora endolithica]
MLFDRFKSRWALGWLAAAVCVSVLLAIVLLDRLPMKREPAAPAVHLAPPDSASTERAPIDSTRSPESVPSAAPAPDGLPVVDYDPAPAGFPPDRDTLDTTPLTEGLSPTRNIPAYDAPGGRPLAYLAPTINGVELITPVVERRVGWVAVLLPSANRRLAWLPPGGWTTMPLRDQLVVERRPHRLTWFRDGRAMHSWEVSLGMPGQATPLGRTFILGRTPPPEAVYGGVDIYAFGAVPDDPSAVPASLRGAHIGLHSWHNDDTLGEDVTNGCIRLTRSAQQQILDEVPPGTSVVVVDALPTPPATSR